MDAFQFNKMIALIPNAEALINSLLDDMANSFAAYAAASHLGISIDEFSDNAANNPEGPEYETFNNIRDIEVTPMAFKDIGNMILSLTSTMPLGVILGAFARLMFSHLVDTGEIKVAPMDMDQSMYVLNLDDIMNTDPNNN